MCVFDFVLIVLVRFCLSVFLYYIYILCIYANATYTMMGVLSLGIDKWAVVKRAQGVSQVVSYDMQWAQR